MLVRGVQDEDERAAKMAELIAGPFAAKVAMLAAVLTAQPGPYVLGDTLSYADFHLFSYIGQFLSGAQLRQFASVFVPSEQQTLLSPVCMSGAQLRQFASVFVPSEQQTLLSPVCMSGAQLPQNAPVFMSGAQPGPASSKTPCN